MIVAPAAAEAVERAVAELAAGRMIVLVDDADREDEGDLICAAVLITDAQMAFLVRHTTGIVCVPMTEERANRLELLEMVSDNADPHHTVFTVSVDLVGTGTGVSAGSRAATVRALADPALHPQQLQRPGHVFPLRARDGGVLVRAGHTEATVELLGMAGLSGVGVICEILAEDGNMRRGDDLRRFAEDRDLVVLDIADLVAVRRAEHRIAALATSNLPTEFGDFRVVAFRDLFDGTEHAVLSMGDVGAAGWSDRGALVRVHSECLTGDVLGSLRCDCGDQLRAARRAIAEEGNGVLVYLRGQEGRGIGLAAKIRAYDLQEQGLDTVDANLVQGLPVDSRRYEVAARMLSAIGLGRVRLITNNPDKQRGIAGFGVEVVGRVSMPTSRNPHNLRYLRTKQDRLGHTLVDHGASA